MWFWIVLYMSHFVTVVLFPIQFEINHPVTVVLVSAIEIQLVGMICRFTGYRILGTDDAIRLFWRQSGFGCWCWSSQSAQWGNPLGESHESCIWWRCSDFDTGLCWDRFNWRGRICRSADSRQISHGVPRNLVVDRHYLRVSMMYSVFQHTLFCFSSNNLCLSWTIKTPTSVNTDGTFGCNCCPLFCGRTCTGNTFFPLQLMWYGVHSVCHC